jgi:hypothetical protein
MAHRDSLLGTLKPHVSMVVVMNTSFMFATSLLDQVSFCKITFQPGFLISSGKKHLHCLKRKYERLKHQGQLVEIFHEEPNIVSHICRVASIVPSFDPFAPKDNHMGLHWTIPI